MKAWRVSIAVLFTLVLLTGRGRADDSILLEVMAATGDVSSASSAGHAFMCIELTLRSGIKEDCFGFYPKGDAISAFIGGPGVAHNEFEKNPSRFAIVAASYKGKITEETRKRILRAVNDANETSYKLTNSNCIDFIDKVAKLAGWKTPVRNTLQKPVEYVKALARENGGA